ncbi:MAG TPA: YHS domain-containing (seleno)protein [Aliidongia sp.]|nr:YHS domain-containing (seleno)protein [Aliidongia sp.]
MTRFTLGAAGALVLAAFSGLAQAGEVNVQDGIAIKGYDPVAYFTDHKPVKGKAAYKADYDGATYEFASAKHRKLFVAAPEKYAPQFGGFCAFGTANGHKADVDPAAFSIVDGKLYLNYSTKVQATWKQDVPGYIHKAEDAWPAVSQQTDVIH